MLTLIAAYFDLGIPTEVLLKKLLSELPISIVIGVFLVWFEDWAIKKGEIINEEGNEN